MNNKNTSEMENEINEGIPKNAPMALKPKITAKINDIIMAMNSKK